MQKIVWPLYQKPMICVIFWIPIWCIGVVCDVVTWWQHVGRWQAHFHVYSLKTKGQKVELGIWKVGVVECGPLSSSYPLHWVFPSLKRISWRRMRTLWLDLPVLLRLSLLRASWIYPNWRGRQRETLPWSNIFQVLRLLRGCIQWCRGIQVLHEGAPSKLLLAVQGECWFSHWSQIWGAPMFRWIHQAPWHQWRGEAGG